MRSVVFDVSGVLEAFDYRGVLIHSQEIQANEKVKLPFTQKNFFKFNGVSFGVCEGVGDLDYRDYPKNLNFNALLVESIENYLLNAKAPKNTQQKDLLADFLEVYDKNIEKGFIYLKPKFFLEKEKELIETTTRLLTSYQIFLNQA
ncbi:histidinol dehydrogenase, partial [Helicobacter pylori]|uniref:histidinol dehydrogenase n=1 Tax=Helicobacter pylori TaxID=210 RepID=UPI000D37E93D